jgi:hypothetical protein
MLKSQALSIVYTLQYFTTWLESKTSNFKQRKDKLYHLRTLLKTRLVGAGGTSPACLAGRLQGTPPFRKIFKTLFYCNHYLDERAQRAKAFSFQFRKRENFRRRILLSSSQMTSLLLSLFIRKISKRTNWVNHWEDCYLTFH